VPEKIDACSVGFVEFFEGVIVLGAVKDRAGTRDFSRVREKRVLDRACAR
jgi:hypothetical protein